MKKSIAIFFLSAVITTFFSLNVKSQTRVITEKDKKEIIAVILQKRFKKELENVENLPEWRKNVYVFLEDKSLNQIPQFKGLNFIKITEDEKKRFGKTGGYYYNFGSFIERNSIVEINFGYTQIGYDRGSASGTKYECQKVSNHWEIKKEHFGGIAHFYL